MDVVQTFEKTLTAAGRKLASATAMSNLSAKAARIAKAKKRARAFLSAQSTVEFSTHPILDHSGLTEAINTLILKERVPGTAAEWLTAITSELKEVESRRLTPLTPEIT